MIIVFSKSFTESFCRSRYRQHNLYVKRTCPKEQLLIYNVKQGWGPLCKFLDVPEPNVPFPKKNVASSFIQEVTSNRGENDAGFSAMTHKQLVTRLSLAGISLVLIIFYLIYRLIA